MAGSVRGLGSAQTGMSVPPGGVLAGLLRVAPGDRDAAAGLCAEVGEWAALVEGAARHGIVGPIANRVDGLVPEPFQADLRRRVAVEELWHARMMAALGEVVTTLASHGIEVVALKGPLIAERHYPAGESRVSVDLDVLILPETLDAAVVALKSLGYYVDLYSELQRHSPYSSHLALKHASGPLVELHFRLAAQRRSPLETADLLARSLPFRSRCGFAVRVLAPEDEFLWLAIHATEHGLSALSRLYDLKLLVEQNPGLKWETVARRATTNGHQTAVYMTVQALRSDLGVTAPAERMALVPNWVARRHPGFLRRQIAAPSNSPAGVYPLRQLVMTALVCDPLWRGPFIFVSRVGRASARHLRLWGEGKS